MSTQPVPLTTFATTVLLVSLFLTSRNFYKFHSCVATVCPLSLAITLQNYCPRLARPLEQNILSQRVNNSYLSQVMLIWNLVMFWASPRPLLCTSISTPLKQTHRRPIHHRRATVPFTASMSPTSISILRPRLRFSRWNRTNHLPTLPMTYFNVYRLSLGNASHKCGTNSPLICVISTSTYMVRAGSPLLFKSYKTFSWNIRTDSLNPKQISGIARPCPFRLLCNPAFRRSLLDHIGQTPSSPKKSMLFWMHT